MIVPPLGLAATARSSSRTCTSARPGCQADFLLDFLRTDRLRHAVTWSATSSTAGGCERRWHWPQTHNDVIQQVLRKARKGTRVDLHPRQPRRVRAPFPRPRLRRHRGRRGACTSPPTAGACWSCTATYSTASIQCAHWLALLGDRALRCCAESQPLRSTRARARLGLAVLVAVAVPEAQGQERGELHHRVRAARRARGAAARARRRRLRPHPQGRDPRDRRHPLLQRRRLGRKPDRAGRDADGQLASSSGRPSWPSRAGADNARRPGAEPCQRRCPPDGSMRSDRHRCLGAAGERRGASRCEHRRRTRALGHTSR